MHLAVKPAEGSTAVIATYNGFTATITNAEAVPIVPLTLDGEINRAATSAQRRCRNFQFGANVYGGR